MLADLEKNSRRVVTCSHGSCSRFMFSDMVQNTDQ